MPCGPPATLPAAAAERRLRLSASTLSNKIHRLRKGALHPAHKWAGFTASWMQRRFEERLCEEMYRSETFSARVALHPAHKWTGFTAS